MKREYLYGMLAIGLLAIMAAGLYYYFLPREADENVTATLLVFSSKSDPTWQISGQKDLQTLKGFLKDIPAAENPNWQSPLGYRGIALEPVRNESLGISGRIVVWNGIIEFSHDGKYVYYTDVYGLEDWLKEKARTQGFGDLIVAFQIPNPASVYCEQHGGRLEIRTDAAGGQFGVCVFPDGSECEEWAFYRGECRPGKFTFSVSGCLKDSGRNAVVVDIVVNGNMVNMKHHLNYVCCARIELEMNILESYPPILRITEKNAGEMCKCLCDYDIEASLGPLEEGEYVIQVWGVAFKDAPASLIFEKRINIKPGQGLCGPSVLGPYPRMMIAQ